MSMSPAEIAELFSLDPGSVCEAPPGSVYRFVFKTALPPTEWSTPEPSDAGASLRELNERMRIIWGDQRLLTDEEKQRIVGWFGSEPESQPDLMDAVREIARGG